MHLPSNGYRDARIVVLDDNPVNVELLLNLLEEHGYHALQGLTDPLELAPLLEKGLPDLILLDIRMPLLDGHQVLDQLRTRWGAQTPPAIVLSAQTDRETRLRSLALGARDFLAKPFDQQEVLQRIHNTLEVHFLLRERSDQALLLRNLVDQRTAEIRRLSFQDPVTGLPNRPALIAALERAAREGQPRTLCHVALDGFDEITRLHGYRVSEALSRQLRDRLQMQLAGSAELAVWNNNEWVISQAALDAGQLAQRIRSIIACIDLPFRLEHLLLRVAARIGVSHSDMPHTSAEHLIRLAILALPEERGRWRLYQPALEDELQRRTRFRQALEGALDGDQMFLVYQPKVELDSGRVVGAEALLRWMHPQFGFVPPSEFIPLAEVSGEILRIGGWVLDRVIRQLEQWLDEDALATDFRIAVNVAALQLMQPDFTDALIERLQRSRLPAGAIEIEVTESGLMQDIELASRQLQRLAGHGLAIAIDDFGTGHSSLAYLKNLPVSVLKIDRAFVNDIDSNLQDRRLAETVVQMARNFGFGTVAEGIERAEHVDILQEIGCHHGQGYWFSPPLKPEAFIAFCRRQQAMCGEPA